MSSSNDVAMAALAAKVEQLGQVCARLSRENAELRHQLSRPQAAQGHVALPAAAARRAAAGAAPTLLQGTAADSAARASSDHGQQPDRKVSRRAIGKALGAAAAGVVGAAALVDLGPAAPAGANTGSNLVSGSLNTAQSTTTLQYNGSSFGLRCVMLVNDTNLNANESAFPAVVAAWAGGTTSGTGGTTTGVYGFSQADEGFGVIGVNNGPGTTGAGAGVRGTAPGPLTSGVDGFSAHGNGVRGASTDGIGVLGMSTSANGVLGTSTSANGVRGQAAGSAAGVNGDNSGSGPGVHGQSASGRGGQFAGAAAQIQLVPGTAATHPTSGHAGDLYADSNGRLWFCTAGGAHATWKQIV